MDAYLHGTAVLGGGDGLQNQYIWLHVKRIDKAALQRALKTPTQAKLAGVSVDALDTLPKAILDLAVPVVSKLLKDDYGIDAEIALYDAPPKQQARAKSEFFPGVLAGAILASLVWGGKHLIFG